MHAFVLCDLCDFLPALDIVPNDPKSLFRRCQAYEEMGSYEDAYKDITSLLRVDPKNAAIQPVLSRLNPIMQEKVRISLSNAHAMKCSYIKA